jgi:hypothetical protein
VTATTPGAATAYFTSGIDYVYPGDIFNFGKVDFGRRGTAMDIKLSPEKTENESLSGVRETLIYNARDRINLTVGTLTETERLALLRWWASAQQGEPFCVAIDSAETYHSKITAFTHTAGAADITCVNVSGVIPTDVLVLKSASGHRVELVTVSNVAGSVITVGAPGYVYQAGDEIMTTNFWSRVMTTDNQLGLSLPDPAMLYWDVSINFREARF